MINITQEDDSLIISYVNEKGQIDLLDIEIPEEERFEWDYAKPGDKVNKDFMSWDNKKVKKIKSKRPLSRYRIQEFLLNQSDDIKEKLFSERLPKLYFCDIETDILDEFPDPKNPKAEVLTIALVSESDKCIVLGTKDLSKDEISNISNKLNDYFNKFNKNITFHYQKFETEFELLDNFFNTFYKKIPLITGWNFMDFDWTYLMNRARLLNINLENISPTKEIDKKSLIPKHKLVLDYMDLYKRWDTKVKIKEGSGLDSVADSLLGIKKIKYSGSLKDLYRDDYEHYVYYNVVDAFLVKLIHEKSDTLSPFIFLGNKTKVENLRAFGSVHLVEMVTLEEFYNKGRIYIKKYKESNNEEDAGYEGAFVMKPIADIYKWLCTFDFSSLYPTTIRQWNISPETFIRKSKEKFHSDKTIQTSSGSIFKKDEDSVLRTILSRMFAERKLAKKSAGIVESEISYLKGFL